MRHKVRNPKLVALLLAALSSVFTAFAGDDLAAEAGTAIKNLQSADSAVTNLSRK